MLRGEAVEHVLVVLPAYNEEASVASVIAEIRSLQPGFDVLVVNDGSIDRTADVARAAGAAVLTAPFNLGVGGAMRTGFRYAAERGYDRVVQVDADGQHDPGEIDAMLALFDDEPLPQMVIGARFAGQGDYKVGRARRFAMRLLARSLSRIAHSTLTDVTSGFRAHNAEAIALFARSYPTDYLADTVESLAVLARLGGKVRQCPAVMRPRTTGQPSQSAWKASVYLVRILMVLGLTLIRRPPQAG
jgi:glycosyltransferase involved in cell wall biosynthesis